MAVKDIRIKQAYKDFLKDHIIELDFSKEQGIDRDK